MKVVLQNSRAHIFLMFFVVFCSVFAPAQTIDGYYASKGVSLREGETAQSLSGRFVVSDTHKIVVEEEGIAILVYNEKVLLLNSKGKYSHSELISKFEKSKPSESGKYLRYNLYKEKSQAIAHQDSPEQGIVFPADSSLIISNSFNIILNKNVIPGFVFFYRGSKVIFAISIADEKMEIKNMGLIDTGSWSGLAVAANDNAPKDGIVYVRWASDKEKQNAELQMRNLLNDILEYPELVQSEVIQAYFEANHYVTAQTK